MRGTSVTKQKKRTTLAGPTDPGYAGQIFVAAAVAGHAYGVVREVARRYNRARLPLVCGSSPAATTSDYPLEGDLDPAYISALAALAGAIIGGLTSFATSWLTQRTQLRQTHREAERAELKALYTDFITEAARLLATP